MLYALTILAVIIAACWAGIRLERQIHRWIRNDYLRLLVRICAGEEVDIDKFTTFWNGHPSCQEYTTLLNNALAKAREQYLGV